MGVASRVADYAQKPALHEGRGMVAGRHINVRPGLGFPCQTENRPAGGGAVPVQRPCANRDPGHTL